MRKPRNVLSLCKVINQTTNIMKLRSLIVVTAILFVSWIFAMALVIVKINDATVELWHAAIFSILEILFILSFCATATIHYNNTLQQ